MQIPHDLLQIGFHRRSLSWRDFESLCLRSGILWLFAPIQLPGLYCVPDDQPGIVLSDRLREPERTLIAFHELAHHYLHTPELNLFGHPNRAKTEFQAHALALGALLPGRVPLSGWPSVPAHWLTARRVVWDRYKW